MALPVPDRIIDLSDVDADSITDETPFVKRDTDGIFRGAGSAGDSHFVHNQISAQATWSVTHNLGKHPSVTVVDSAGTQVYGEVEYPSLNQVVLTFSAAFSGTAYLN